MRLLMSALPYTRSTQGEYRDLRQVELKAAHGRFVRVSMNGIHCCTQTHIRATRDGNPGWSFGLDRAYINWTHFRRHCWHASIVVGRRGVTLSYGKARW